MNKRSQVCSGSGQILAIASVNFQSLALLDVFGNLHHESRFQGGWFVRDVAELPFTPGSHSVIKSSTAAGISRPTHASL